MRSLTLSVAFFASAAWGAAPVPVADVALTTSKYQQPIVIAEVGGQQVECIVDTGADVGVLQSSLVRGGERVGVTNVNTAIGAIAMPLVDVPRFAVGGAEAKRVRFLVRDRDWFVGRPQQCVLGRSFYDRYTVDIDGAAGRLRLYARGTRIDAIVPAAVARDSRLDITVRGSLWMDTRVQNVPTRSMLDTGWGIASLNAAALDALGIGAADERLVTKMWTDPSNGHEHAYRFVEVTDVVLGPHHVDRTRVLAERDDTVTVRRQSKPYLHVGWDLLSRYRFLIDYSRVEAALVAPTGGETAP